MDLDNYREKYNQDFHLNTEKKNCLCRSSKNKKLFNFDDTYLKQSC